MPNKRGGARANTGPRNLKQEGLKPGQDFVLIVLRGEQATEHLSLHLDSITRTNGEHVLHFTEKWDGRKLIMRRVIA